MRVAFFVTSFPAPSETFISDQVIGLLRRGCRVDVFSAAPAGVIPATDSAMRELASHVRCSRLCRRLIWRPLSGLRAVVQAIRDGRRVPIASLNPLRHGRRAVSLEVLHDAAVFAQPESYDVIHAHFGPNGLRAMALRELGLIHGRLVTSFYGYDVSAYVMRHGERVYEALFRACDAITAVSDTMAKRLVSLGCPRPKVRVHRLGVDPDVFAFRTDEEPNGSVPRVLSASRLVPKKGLEHGIHAVASLKSRGISLRYDIVGDGPMRPGLEQAARELGLGDTVFFAGWKQREELVTMLRQAHVFMAPSLTAPDGDEEGTPVALMEAMATGVPVLTTRHAGIPELVQTGESGYLVEEGGTTELAERLADLVGSSSVRLAMGRAGRDRILDQYNINRQNDHLVTVYSSLATQGDSSPSR